MSVAHWTIELADYRRQVAENYARARAGGAGERPWLGWRADRDRMIGAHPQSPLPEPERSPDWSTPFYPYDPQWRTVARLEPADDPAVIEVSHSSDGTTKFTEVGRVTFRHDRTAHSLTLFWLDAYAGGLFLPFRDATAGNGTYGGGRYLLDTAKGADLGTDSAGRLILDFNYAYHPSCAWDHAWSCPLAPPSNGLSIPIEAGELVPRPPSPASRPSEVRSGT